MILAWKIAPYAVAAVAAFAAWKMLELRIENRGAERVIQKVEKANATAITRSASAGRKSADPDTPGVRLPTYRD